MVTCQGGRRSRRQRRTIAAVRSEGKQTKGATMSDTTTAANITQIGTVMVPVSDQDRALAFYCEKLGFEKRADVPFGGSERWVEVAPSGSAASPSPPPPPQ